MTGENAMSVYHPDDYGPRRGAQFLPPPPRFKGAGKVKEGKDTKERARIAAEEWKFYEDKIAPVENRLFAKLKDTAGARTRGLGAAAADTSRQFSDADRAVESSLTNAGARLGSGRSNLARAGLALDRGQSQGLTSVDVNQAADDARLRGLRTIVDIGQGRSAEAQAGMNDLAQLSQQQSAYDAQAAAQNRAAGLSAVGTAAGLGLGSLNRDYSSRVNRLNPMLTDVGSVQPQVPVNVQPFVPSLYGS